MKLLPFVLFLIYSFSSAAQLEYKHLKNRWSECVFAHDQSSDTLTFKRSNSEDQCSNTITKKHTVSHQEMSLFFKRKGVVEILTVRASRPENSIIEDTTYTVHVVTDTIVDSLGKTVVRTNESKVPNLIDFGHGSSHATYQSTFYVLDKRKNTLEINNQTYEVILLTEETLILRKY